MNLMASTRFSQIGRGTARDRNSRLTVNKEENSSLLCEIKSCVGKWEIWGIPTIYSRDYISHLPWGCLRISAGDPGQHFWGEGWLDYSV